MKKFFAITTAIMVALAGFAVGANAQNLTFGAKVGLNVSTITNIDALLYYPQSNDSFNAGVFAEYKFNRYFGISPEIVYSGQGVFIGTYWVGPGPSGFTLQLDYINVPVLAKFYPVKWLSIDLGPQIGFLAVVKIKDNPRPLDVKDSFKGADFGLAMGLTVNIGRHIFLQGRYNLGLTDISRKNTSVHAISFYDNSDDPFEKSKNLTNRVFQIGLGVRFGLPKK